MLFEPGVTITKSADYDLAGDLRRLGAHVSQCALLESVREVISYDTSMLAPPDAEANRPEMMGLLDAQLSQLYSSQEIRDLLERLFAHKDELTPDQGLLVARMRREMFEASRLPEEFVRSRAKSYRQSLTAFYHARAANDFSKVQKAFEQVLVCWRKEAYLKGYRKTPYDCFLGNWEHGLRIDEIEQPLLMANNAVYRLLPGILERCGQWHDTVSPASVEVSEGELRRIIAQIALDLGLGDWRLSEQLKQSNPPLGVISHDVRIDTHAHPSLDTLSPNDLRITIRLNPSDALTSILDFLHEAGHALYERGVDPDFRGTPLGRITMSAHESQAIFWENHIGRSRAGAAYLFSLLQRIAPQAAQRTSVQQIYVGANNVHTSPVRMDADEVTFLLHVAIRTELERRMVARELEACDLTAAWNELYRERLGIEPQSLTESVLQEDHWYAGDFVGYFPLYGVGTLAAAAFAHTVRHELPKIDEQIAAGDFRSLRSWLWDHIYRHGGKFTTPELVKQVTGERLNEQPFVDYLGEKFGLM